MSTTIRRWFCWHPDLGYLRIFDNYEAFAYDYPDPRAGYVYQGAAEVRQDFKHFYVDGDEYYGKDIQIRCVEFTWQVVEEAVE